MSRQSDRFLAFPVASDHLGDEDEPAPKPVYRLVEAVGYAHYSWDHAASFELKTQRQGDGLRTDCGLEKARAVFPRNPRNYFVRCFPPRQRIDGASSNDLTDEVCCYDGTSDYGAGYLAQLRTAKSCLADPTGDASPPLGTCVLVSIAYDAGRELPRFGRICTGTDIGDDTKVQLIGKWRATWRAFHTHGRAVLVLLPDDAQALRSAVKRFADVCREHLERDAREVGRTLQWDGSPPTIHRIGDLDGILEDAQSPVLVGMVEDELGDLVLWLDGQHASLPGEHVEPWDLGDAAWRLRLRDLARPILAARSAPSVIGVLLLVLLAGLLNGYLSWVKSRYDHPDYYIHIALPEKNADGDWWDEPLPICDAAKEPDIAVVLDGVALTSRSCNDAYGCNIPVYDYASPPPWEIQIVEDDADCAGRMMTSWSPSCGPVVLETTVDLEMREVDGIRYQVVREPVLLPKDAERLARARERCMDSYLEHAKRAVASVLADPSSAGVPFIVIVAVGVLLLTVLLVALIFFILLARIHGKLSKLVDRREATFTAIWGNFTASIAKLTTWLSKKLGHDAADERAMMFQGFVRANFHTAGTIIRVAEPLILFGDTICIIENADEAVKNPSVEPQTRFYKRDAIFGFRFDTYPLRVVIYVAIVWLVAYALRVGPSLEHFNVGLVGFAILFGPLVLLAWLAWRLRLVTTRCRFELSTGNIINVHVPHHGARDRQVLEAWFSGVERATATAPRPPDGVASDGDP